jgi:type IV pilus assembly protein PilE
MLSGSRGFTLIELMVVTAVIAVLVSAGYPSYTEYVKKTRRTEVAGLLTEEAQRLERFYSKAGQYSDVAGPAMLSHQVSEGNAHYAIAAPRQDQTFVLTAKANGALMKGDKCGGFVLDNTGKRDNVGMSGDASVLGCWGR